MPNMNASFLAQLVKNMPEMRLSLHFTSLPWISKNTVRIFFPNSQFNPESGSVISDSLWPHGLYSPWNSQVQNTGVGSLSLFQGIFPTQGSNPGLPHCRGILYQLSHKGNPRILEWVAYSISRGSSWPRVRTFISCISCIGRHILYHWAT